MMGDPQRKRQRLDLSDLKPAGAGDGGGAGGTGGEVNPHTGQGYSRRYHEILSKRRGLPVYDFLDELLGKVKKNQVSSSLRSCVGCFGGWWWCVVVDGWIEGGGAFRCLSCLSVALFSARGWMDRSSSTA